MFGHIRIGAIHSSRPGLLHARTTTLLRLRHRATCHFTDALTGLALRLYLLCTRLVVNLLPHSHALGYYLLHRQPPVFSTCPLGPAKSLWRCSPHVTYRTARGLAELTSLAAFLPPLLSFTIGPFAPCAAVPVRLVDGLEFMACAR
jgi:hypothetical protein